MTVKVLLLGSTGFLGSWTARALLAAEADVSVFTRPGSPPWRLEPLLDRLERHVADPSAWPALVRRIEPEVVLSLDWAGVAGADKNDPSQWENLPRLEALVEAAAVVGARRFVGVGSQAEYGPHTGVISEDEETRPVTAYGQAKLAASRRLLARGDELGLECAWARVFSTFGPLDHPHWVLPQLAQQVVRGEKASLTDGTQRWSYLSGSDAGRAFATLALAGEARGIFNLGHPEAPVLRETIETFVSALGLPADLDFGAIPHTPTSVMWLQPDVSRLAALGWQPALPMATALEMTARWLLGDAVADPLLPGLHLPLTPFRG